ncbi:PREDICTED: PX domain-containing protein 1 [Chaetura pelagica]|nr:PREDICTED: PX domain-containing protein 1 [Chaetura pelagica]
MGESRGHPDDQGNVIKIEDEVVVRKPNYQRYDGLEHNSHNYTNDVEYSQTGITQASEDLLREHYIDLKDRPFYDGLVQYMHSGPVVAMCAFVYAHNLFTLFPGLITIKEAHDIEARLNEVEKLLKTIINMPWKYSRSEVVLTFFERSPLDQVLKNDNVHKIQPSFQSPVKISEIMRSNGFCLANTETIVIDHSIPNGKEKHLDVDSAEHLFESVSDFTSELEDSDDPTAYVTNLTYYHLVPFETDILD